MNICIFGSASDKIDGEFIKDTELLGEKLAKRGHNLVYGAGANGLMGAAARGFHRGGGHITGIIPHFFREEGIEGIYDCDELIYTQTMNERKQKMEDYSQAFIIVPGGIGTYEEFFEVLTAKQLRRHNKPIAIYDDKGYYKPLYDLMEDAIAKKFVKENCRTIYRYFTNIEDMIAYVESDSLEEMTVHDLKDG